MHPVECLRDSENRIRISDVEPNYALGMFGLISTGLILCADHASRRNRLRCRYSPNVLCWFWQHLAELVELLLEIGRECRDGNVQVSHLLAFCHPNWYPKRNDQFKIPRAIQKGIDKPFFHNIPTIFWRPIPTNRKSIRSFPISGTFLYYSYLNRIGKICVPKICSERSLQFSIPTRQHAATWFSDFDRHSSKETRVPWSVPVISQVFKASELVISQRITRNKVECRYWYAEIGDTKDSSQHEIIARRARRRV